MSNRELRVLKSLVKSYEIDKEPFYLRGPILVIGWFVLVTIFVIVKRMLETGNLNIYIAMFLLTLFGAAIGFVSIIKASYKCRPFIRPYIDIDAAKIKVAELEKNA